MLSKVTKIDNKQKPAIDALGAVREYLNTRGNINVVEEIYYLLGGWQHSNNATDYQYVSMSLLAALADPDISSVIKKKMGSNTYENLIEMLNRMWSFCRSMDEAPYEALLTAYRLENDDNLSPQILTIIEDEYKLKLAQSDKVKAA